MVSMDFGSWIEHLGIEPSNLKNKKALKYNCTPRRSHDGGSHLLLTCLAGGFFRAAKVGEGFPMG
jgi:hypothetical protein